MYILAKGTKFGKRWRIEVKNKKFLFNGSENKAMMKILDLELKSRPVYDGTYVPTDAYEDANIYNVLKNFFFDDNPQITANSMQKLPNEGEVY